MLDYIIQNTVEPRSSSKGILEEEVEEQCQEFIKKIELGDEASRLESQIENSHERLDKLEDDMVPSNDMVLYGIKRKARLLQRPKKNKAKKTQTTCCCK